MAKRGKKYRALAASYDVKAFHALDEALNILKKSEFKFDQTVELHFNLGVDPKHSDQMVRGSVTLPHGTGRKVRILALCKDNMVQAAVDAGADFAGGADMVQKISEGWLAFDAVVATPDMMAVLGKVAKVLGPRGLMPSPKAGTVTPNLAQIIKELKAGKIQYRVDKGANVHTPVGKLSFSGEQLRENILMVIDSVKKNKPQTSKGVYIKSLTLTATMTPSVRLDTAITR
ncbi:MAG: 50S ribosomal protein L1 [Fibromonadaceae bacterium]|jgi:large subunit ribosomal protein L1|nr:50S ribosomal protein L1 [Fibromonadaceae bacterium]